MAGKEHRLASSSRLIVVALLVMTILDWPRPIWSATYGFDDTVTFINYDDFQFDEYLGHPIPITFNGHTLGVLDLLYGLVNTLFATFCLIKIAIFSMDLDQRTTHRVRMSWMKAFLIIDAIFFVLILAFSIVYIVYNTSHGRLRGDWPWGLMALTLGLQVLYYPIAVKLYSSARVHGEYSNRKVEYDYVQHDGSEM